MWSAAEIDGRTVATGVWVYGGETPMSARILGLPYDYWYALGEADEQLDEGETPEPLGPDGLLYYAFFVGIAGPACATIEQAKHYAQSKVPTPIKWIE